MSGPTVTETMPTKGADEGMQRSSLIVAQTTKKRFSESPEVYYEGNVSGTELTSTKAGTKGL